MDDDLFENPWGFGGGGYLPYSYGMPAYSAPMAQVPYRPGFQGTRGTISEAIQAPLLAYKTKSEELQQDLIRYGEKLATPSAPPIVNDAESWGTAISALIPMAMGAFGGATGAQAADLTAKEILPYAFKTIQDKQDYLDRQEILQKQLDSQIYSNTQNRIQHLDDAVLRANVTAANQDAMMQSSANLAQFKAGLNPGRGSGTVTNGPGPKETPSVNSSLNIVPNANLSKANQDTVRKLLAYKPIVGGKIYEYKKDVPPVRNPEKMMKEWGVIDSYQKDVKWLLNSLNQTKYLTGLSLSNSKEFYQQKAKLARVRAFLKGNGSDRISGNLGAALTGLTEKGLLDDRLVDNYGNWGSGAISLVSNRPFVQLMEQLKIVDQSMSDILDSDLVNEGFVPVQQDQAQGVDLGLSSNPGSENSENVNPESLKRIEEQKNLARDLFRKKQSNPSIFSSFANGMGWGE